MCDVHAINSLPSPHWLIHMYLCIEKGLYLFMILHLEDNVHGGLSQRRGYQEYQRPSSERESSLLIVTRGRKNGYMIWEGVLLPLSLEFSERPELSSRMPRTQGSESLALLVCSILSKLEL